MTDPISDIERRLNVQAQQHILNELSQLKNRQQEYNYMISVLAFAIVTCIVGVALNQHKLERMTKRVRSIERPRQVIFQVPVDKVQETAQVRPTQYQAFS